MPFGISTGELAHYRAGVEGRAGRTTGRATRTTRYIGREPRKTLREQPRREEEKRVRVPDPSNPGNTIYVPASEEYNYRKLSADIRTKERGEAGALQKLMQDRETEDYDTRYELAEKMAWEDYKADQKDKSLASDEKMHSSEIPARIAELMKPEAPIEPEAPPKRSLLQTLGDVALFGPAGLMKGRAEDEDYAKKQDKYKYDLYNYEVGQSLKDLSRGRRQPLKEKYPSRFREQEEAPAPRRQVAQPDEKIANRIEEARNAGYSDAMIKKDLMEKRINPRIYGL